MDLKYNRQINNNINNKLNNSDAVEVFQMFSFDSAG